MHRSKKTSKLRVTGLCEGNSPVTGEFPAQRSSNAEKSSHFMTSSYDLRSWDTSIVKLFYHVPSSIASLVRFKVSTFSINAQWIVQSFIQEFMPVTRKSSSNWRNPTKNMPVDGIVLYWTKYYIYIYYIIYVYKYWFVINVCAHSAKIRDIRPPSPTPNPNLQIENECIISWSSFDFLISWCYHAWKRPPYYWPFVW